MLLESIKLHGCLKSSEGYKIVFFCFAVLMFNYLYVMPFSNDETAYIPLAIITLLKAYLQYSYEF